MWRDLAGESVCQQGEQHVSMLLEKYVRLDQRVAEKADSNHRPSVSCHMRGTYEQHSKLVGAQLHPVIGPYSDAMHSAALDALQHTLVASSEAWGLYIAMHIYTDASYNFCQDYEDLAAFAMVILLELP
eukprot:8091797-Karenia_brevis.AAC.1